MMAIPLGILTNRANKQRVAVAKIQELDGLVKYDEPAWSMGLDKFLGLDYFADAVRVEFFHYDYDHPDFDLPVYFEVEKMDAMLQPMKQLPKLQTVKLYYLRQAPWVEKYRTELPNVEFEIIE